MAIIGAQKKGRRRDVLNVTAVALRLGRVPNTWGAVAEEPVGGETGWYFFGRSSPKSFRRLPQSLPTERFYDRTIPLS